MAKTFKCKTCGAEISKKAKTCPNCGHPYKRYTIMEKFMMTVIGVVGFLALVGVIFGDHNTGKTANAPTINTKAKTVKHIPKTIPGYEKYSKEIEEGKQKLKKALSKERQIMAYNIGYNMMGKDIMYVNIAMMDDHTRRDGYAEYVCLLANEAGLTKKKYDHTVWVKIHDAKSAIGGGNIRVIGEKRCVNQ